MRARSVRGRVAGRMYRMLDMRGGYRNLVNNQLLEQIRRAFLRLLNHPHCAVVDRSAKRREGPNLDARPASLSGQHHMRPAERPYIAESGLANL
jgi:hypothetical protein